MTKQVPIGFTVPEPPVIGGDILVVSHSCEVGVSTMVGPLDASGRDAFAPIHPIGGDRDEVIGYWVGGSGWLTPEQAEKAGWDPLRAQELFPDPRLQLEPLRDAHASGGQPAPR